MLRKLMIAVVFLGLGTASASAQYVPYTGRPPVVLQRPYSQGGYWVQFRQPYWRQQTFYSEPEMASFVSAQRSYGWEVQVRPSPWGFDVRYRLMQWGGSRVLPTMADAQQWAAYLEDQGYEPRIVPLAPR